MSGPGAVRSSALQGDCRGTCWFSVTRDTPVHLEAIVDGQSAFAGWSGACNGTGACDLKPGADVSVAATFMPAQPRRLQVSMNGAGTVRSDPAGIDCPQTCAADFPDGTAVRLDATAASSADLFDRVRVGDESHLDRIAWNRIHLLWLLRRLQRSELKTGHAGRTGPSFCGRTDQRPISPAIGFSASIKNATCSTSGRATASAPPYT